ncbi:MAG: transporter [Bacteroidetes bacterium]|nr:transporter [Bacteroidota bacterium]
MKTLSLLLILITLTSINLKAGHPLRGEDAVSVGKNIWQLELTSDLFYDKGRRNFDIPFTATYGLNDNMDFITNIPFHHSSDLTNNLGLGDICLELKWILFNSKNFSAGIKPSLSFASGDRNKGCGKGKNNFALNFIMTVYNDFSNIHLNAGYIRNDNYDNERLNLWFLSAGSELFLSDKIYTMLELGINQNNSKERAVNPAYLVCGVGYIVNNKITLDIGYLIGLNNEETDNGFLFGAGFSI